MFAPIAREKIDVISYSLTILLLVSIFHFIVFDLRHASPRSFIFSFVEMSAAE